MESPRATYIAFGEIESPGDDRTTTIVALSDFSPDVAMTRVMPGDTAATLPNDDTLATVGSADRQSTWTSSVPWSEITCAASWRVAPTGRVSSFGAIDNDIVDDRLRPFGLIESALLQAPAMDITAKTQAVRAR